MTVIAAVRVPQEIKWNPSAAIGLINTIVERYQVPKNKLAEEITELALVAYPGVIEWNLLTSLTDEIDGFAALVRSYYPGAEVYENYIETDLSYPLHKKVGVLCRSYDIAAIVPAFLSANAVRTNSDPLVHLVQAMNELQDSEVVIYRIQLFDYQKRKLPLWAKIAVGISDEMDRQSNPMKMRPPKDQERLMMEARRKIPLVNLGQAVEMYTPNPDRFYILDNVLGAFRNFSGNGYPIYDHYYPHQQRIANEDQLWEYFGLSGALAAMGKTPNNLDFFMTPDELAALWHLPHDQFTASRIDVIRPDLTQLPDALKGIAGILLGHNNGQEVRLPEEDRTTHTIIIGKSGTGKSSLMHKMIHEDIAAGRGLCVIDPHGELVSHILQASIPDERIDDVVILDLAMKIGGVHYPPPLNPLYKTVPDEVSQNIVTTLRRVDPDFAGTQMEYLLELALRTLGGEMQPTLRDIRKLFRDKSYRDALIAKLDDMDLEDDWADFDERSATQQKNDTFPLFRRLRQLSGKKEVLAITCHPDALDIHQLVADNKIILVNIGGADNQIEKEDRLILGSALVAQIERAAMKGAIKDGLYLLYIDETQNFVNTPINDMLAEARKFKLGLVLANQFLGQLTGDVQSAIEGNVGTMISFEIGESDERSMLHYMSTFTDKALTNLGKFKAAVSMRYRDERQPSFLLETLPPPGVDGKSETETEQQAREENLAKRERFVRQKSVANYTPKTYDEVIQLLTKRDDSDDDNLSSGDGRGDDDFTEADPKA